MIVETCAQPGCFQPRPCTIHKAKPSHGENNKSLYSYRWQQARKRFLADRPFCEGECKAANRVTLATVVDHIVPHRGNRALFWDESNWQPLCQSCHSRKTRSGQ